MQTVPSTTDVVKSNLDWGEVYLIQQYVINYVNDMRQVGGLLRVLANKTDRHDITGILLKVALNTINLNPKRTLPIYVKYVVF
jgi:hypothetical protein